MFFQRGVGSIEAIRGPIGRQAILAFDLLKGLDLQRPDADAIIQRIAQTMPGGNHTSRMTMRGRYAIVDDAIDQLLDVRFSGTVRVRDLGASNAIVSVEMFKRLAHRSGLTVEASDHVTEMRCVRLDSGWRVLFDNRGEWMQAIRGDTVLYRRTGLRLSTLTNDAMSLYVGRFIVPEAALRDPTETISLFHTEARQVASAEPRFTLAQRDLMALPERSSEVARLMTVVFGWPADRQRAAIASVGRSLVDGGLLVIGKGRRPGNMKCSIFERRGRHLAWVRDVGKPAHERANVEAVAL